MPVTRKTPLKQNIRVWFDYLKVAIDEKLNINKEYYILWHLPQVKKLKFDKWWSSHKHLFAHKEYINVRVLNELTLDQAMKEVRKQLIDKVNQKTNFHITSKKFRYQQVDDYLKCYKLRKQGLTYNEIAIKIARSYRSKSRSKKVVRRSFGVGNAEKMFDRNVLHSVKKRVNNAKSIIMNTAKGSFTGKY